MGTQLERVEQILGVKFERRDARVIPGTTVVEGQAVVYFADNRKHSFRKQFRALTTHTNPPYATAGGVNERGCKIVLPDGQSFHGISYHGDLDGWRKDIEAGAREFNVLLARIEGGKFVVSDGRVVPLVDCAVEFN